MSKVKIITIACWLITTIVLVGLVAWFVGCIGFGNDSNFGFINIGQENFEERTTYSAHIDDVDFVYVNWTSGRVEVYRHHSNYIQITEFSQRELRRGEEFRATTNDGVLQVEFGGNPGIMRNVQTKRLEILVPYELDVETFNIQTVSGRVYIDGINTDTVEVTTTSGRIETNNVSAQTLELRTTSGRIEVRDSTVDTVNLRTVSGRVGLVNVQAENVQTLTVSGRHYLSGIFGNVRATSTSGRIRLKSAEIPGRINASTTSGRIILTLPDKGEAISVNYATRVGRFMSQIPVITYGGENARFNFSTVSGRVRIFER